MDVAMDSKMMLPRLLAVNSKENVQFSCKNALAPLNIHTEEGLEFDFKHNLEEFVVVDTIVKITACDAAIVDEHAVIQKLAPPSSLTANVTFHETATRFLACRKLATLTFMSANQKKKG